MISQAKSVEEFLSGLDHEEQVFFAELRRRLTVDKKVVESMNYRMPTYQVGKNFFGAFNKQKNYLCLYLDPVAVDPFRAELKKAGLDCGKSCIRFRKPAQLPLPLANKIIKQAIKLAKKSPRPTASSDR
ncbi:MAG: DUF1801 domain-containing protein [Candidatus Didemnitutus sp.]|nr:DUF1801 domain-containing protein [Candidatus Didemnitutus sp.]